MKAVLKAIAGLLLVLIAYLLLWPVPVDPVAWDAPENKGYTGDFAANTDLATLDRLSIGETYGPEDVAARNTDEGLMIYTSAHEGEIIEINPRTNSHRIIANTGGVPLGIEFAPSGDLIVADAHKGLLSVSLDGSVTVLTDSVDGSPILYADDLDIGPDGVIYFSDASTKFGAEASGSTLGGSLLEIMDHGRTGRVLAYEPVDKSTRILRDNFSFPNGIAMGPSGDSIYINETGEYRVLRHWLIGPRKGEMDVVIDNLPGFPDNINPGPDGTYFLGLASPRSKALDDLSAKPFMRKIVQRLPASMRPQAEAYGIIIHIDAAGNVLRTWQDPSGVYPITTGAIMPGDGYMYVSSLVAPDLARLKLE